MEINPKLDKVKPNARPDQKIGKMIKKSRRAFTVTSDELDLM